MRENSNEADDNHLTFHEEEDVPTESVVKHSVNILRISIFAKKFPI